LFPKLITLKSTKGKYLQSSTLVLPKDEKNCDCREVPNSFIPITTFEIGLLKD
jgi:hypothetical protein